MVHLRIVVPPDLTAQVLRVLEQSPAVCNIVVLRGAAMRPAGDVLLCDVPREAASIVLADLQELGVHERGSISVEEVDIALSSAAEEAMRAAPGDPANAVVWEEVEELASESTTLSGSFLIFMTLATLIAAVGIFLDTPILIVGAMVLGPEFGPLASFCVAVVERRPRLALRSFVALVAGFPVGITAAFLASLTFKSTDLTPDEFTEADHSLSVIISSPDFFSFFVAFCAGIAGVLSLTTQKSGALAGVLISVTTIPAAANIGVAAAYQDWSAWRGSQAQLALNIAAICAAGLITLLIQRAIFRRRRAEHLRTDRLPRAGGPPLLR
ncbi:MAG: DUF389 domain-containing protein [Solirubrobacterales bacterium]